ncbi:hypothetical protein PZB74_09290 [Porifericola rhodea]|uniref:hypothetical protein n=1 Tax=Porifericola rhodea TaxID=930972 RepID=UPI0026668277|nr:hypothetical protein [Porifericola rhodea]WKN33523.1 hypothetical protein PZB74_09290 [Porifericola rhodea]
MKLHLPKFLPNAGQMNGHIHKNLENNVDITLHFHIMPQHSLLIKLAKPSAKNAVAALKLATYKGLSN